METDQERELELFELLASVPPLEREKRLLEACPDSPAQRGRILEMLAWEERMDGFLETPFFSLLDTAHPFVPGTVAADRFEIRRDIAEGGMALVFEAYDRKTRRTVALKCPKMAFRMRLVEELCNALMVTHPNICRLYEVHSATAANGQTIDFLTMEYLSGPTLAARLRSGPLSKREVSMVARQICAGLAAAHARNVVHGDLKPGNVILADEGKDTSRVVITDFGLAQALGLDGAPSPWGASLRGTAEYIAPERWHGERASKATDVYALGVLLFEMLTGRRPGACGTKAFTLVPRPWRKLVRNCLATDPLRRPRDAAAVLACLPNESSRPAAAGILILLTAGIAFGGWQWKQAPAVTGAVRLAVLAADTDPPSTVLGNGVALEISERLRRTSGTAEQPLVIIPVEKSTRFRVGTPEAAQRVFGATHSLFMRWRARGDGFEIIGTIADAQTRQTLRQFQGFYRRAAMADLARLIASETSLAFRRTLANPSLPLSYADYAEGIYYLRHAQDAGRARSFFQRMPQAAPDHLWKELRLIQTDLLEYSSSRSAVALENARQRIDAIREPAVATPETALLLASLQDGADRPQLALEEYSRLTSRGENLGPAWRGAAATLERLGRREEAEQAWLKAVDAEPGYFQPRVELGVLYYYRGQYAAARDQFAFVTNVAPGLAVPHFDLAATLVDLNEYDKAEQEYHQALAIEEDPDTLTGIGGLLAYQKRHLESAYYYERAVASGPEDPVRLCNLADAYRRLNRSADAARTYQRVVAVATRILSADPSNASTRSVRAWAMANLRRRQEALQDITTAMRSTGLQKVRKRAVLVFDLLKMRRDAFRLLDQAPASFFSELSRYPDLSSFTATQRFIEASRVSRSQ